MQDAGGMFDFSLYVCDPELQKIPFNTHNQGVIMNKRAFIAFVAVMPGVVFSTAKENDTAQARLYRIAEHAARDAKKHSAATYSLIKGELDRAVYDSSEKVRNGTQTTQEAAYRLKAKAEQLVADAKKEVDEVRVSLKETAQSLGASLDEAVNTAMSMAQEKGQSLKQAATDLAGRAKKMGHDAQEKAEELAKEVTDSSKRYAKEALQSLQDSIDKKDN